MIRINLLPQTVKKAGATQAKISFGPGPSTQVWAGIYAGVVAATGVVLGISYFSMSGELDEKQSINANLQREIQVAMGASSELEQFRARLAASKDLESVVAELQRARLGPTRVLLELAHLISEGGGPQIDPQRLEQLRRENPLTGFNSGWDSRRLWLDSFVEEERECRIKGFGKTNEDVAEFLARISLSELFEEVTLQRTEAKVDTETQLSFIGFEATCKVRY